MRCFVAITILFSVGFLGCTSQPAEPADATANAENQQSAQPSTDESQFSDNDLVGSNDAQPDGSSTKAPSTDATATTKPQISDTVAPEVKALPTQRVLQKYPNSEIPHRAFTAKILPNKGVLLHGAYLEYYSNGKKQKAGAYEYGKKVGEWIFWSKDEVVRKKGTYAQDKQDGKWEKHRSDGTLEWIEMYSNGLKDGTWQAFAEDGQRPLWERNFKAGEPHGEWINYFPDGKKRSVETFVAGKRDGTIKSWYENGQVSLEGTFRDGKRHGTFRTFGQGGAVRDQSKWENGTQLSDS